MTSRDLYSQLETNRAFCLLSLHLPILSCFPSFVLSLCILSMYAPWWINSRDRLFSRWFFFWHFSYRAYQNRERHRWNPGATWRDNYSAGTAPYVLSNGASPSSLRPAIQVELLSISAAWKVQSSCSSPPLFPILIIGQPLTDLSCPRWLVTQCF